MLFFILLSIQITLADDSGTCGKQCIWNYNSQTKQLTISGNGTMNNYDSKVPWDFYKEEIKTVTVERGLISIGNYAFASCSVVTKITMPETITIIGDYVFQECVSLKKIQIPESVRSIGIQAFYGCSMLSSVFIGRDVEFIGAKAFSLCVKVEKFEVDTRNRYYVSVDDVLYDKQMTQVIQYPLNNERLSYELPETIQSIIPMSFAFTSKLDHITIPTAVIEIGEKAFSHCLSLSSVTFTEGLLSIGEEAFSYCQTLKNVVLPESIETIGQGAFRECSLLESIQLPSTLTEIPQNLFIDNFALKSITIGSNVESIGNYAFYQCFSLQKVVIESRYLASIGESAFAYCVSLDTFIYTGFTNPTHCGNEMFSNIITNEVIVTEDFMQKSFCGLNITVSNNPLDEKDEEDEEKKGDGLTTLESVLIGLCVTLFVIAVDSIIAVIVLVLYVKKLKRNPGYTAITNE